MSTATQTAADFLNSLTWSEWSRPDCSRVDAYVKGGTFFAYSIAPTLEQARAEVLAKVQREADYIETKGPMEQVDVIGFWAA